MPPLAPPTIPDTTDPEHYPLGRSDHEARRLTLQHRIYGPGTRQLLQTAGVTSGMRVLDVGSGAGDVALLLADLVGPTGEVVGIEFAAESIAIATDRARAAGVERTVRFVQADLRDLTLDDHFDAIVGRWVLMYQPDPVALLRRLARLLRPGGLIAFQESDLVDVPRPYPPAPVHEQVFTWLTPPEGAPVPEQRMGPKLFGAFVEAGLPAPSLRVDTPAGGGPQWPGYELVAATVRSLLPMMEALGAVSADEVDIETLADRLRDEVVAAHGVQVLAPVYGAWCRMP